MAEFCGTRDVDPDTLIGNLAQNGVMFNSEMADNVRFYLQTIIKDAAQFKIGFKDIAFETRFRLSEIDEDAFGTCDAHFGVAFGKLYVYDLKYGQGQMVAAEDNLQLQYYALGAMMSGDYDEVEMVIVQPRTDDRIKRWSVSRERMEEFAKELKLKIEATKKNDAPLVEGKWCKWCPANATCPQLAKKAVEVAQLDFIGMTPNTPVPTPLTRSPEPGVLTLPQLKKVLDKADVLRDWLTSVESYALSLAEAGTKIDGWKLVPKRAHRKWRDEFEVETNLADFGDAIYDKKLKTPKQMEVIAGKEKVSELSIVPNNGNTLVIDDDVREESVVEFKPITDETKPKPISFDEGKKKGRPKGSKNVRAEKSKSNDTDIQSIFS
jgi:hypothetical protein